MTRSRPVTPAKVPGSTLPQPKDSRRLPFPQPHGGSRHKAGMTMGAVLALALAGCSMEPKYVQPAAPVPPSWPVGDAYLKQSEAALPAVTWRDIFRDSRLQKLIVQALAENRDLRLAAANIRAARPDLVVTANPGCLLQIRRHLASNGSTGPAGAAGTLPELPLLHPVQLLDASIRGVPVALA